MSIVRQRREGTPEVAVRRRARRSRLRARVDQRGTMSGKLDALRRIGLLGLLSVGVSCSCHRATPGDSPASVTIQAAEAGTAPETTPRPQEMNDAGGARDGGAEEGDIFALDTNAADGGPLTDSLGRPFLVTNWNAAADKIAALPEFRRFANDLDRESHGEARVGLYPEGMPRV